MTSGQISISKFVKVMTDPTSSKQSTAGDGPADSSPDAPVLVESQDVLNDARPQTDSALVMKEPSAATTQAKPKEVSAF